jgi:hypothetical protein
MARSRHICVVVLTGPANTGSNPRQQLCSHAGLVCKMHPCVRGSAGRYAGQRRRLRCGALRSVPLPSIAAGLRVYPERILVRDAARRDAGRTYRRPRTLRAHPSVAARHRVRRAASARPQCTSNVQREPSASHGRSLRGGKCRGSARSRAAADRRSSSFLRSRESGTFPREAGSASPASAPFAAVSRRISAETSGLRMRARKSSCGCRPRWYGYSATKHSRRHSDARCKATLPVHSAIAPASCAARSHHLPCAS